MHRTPPQALAALLAGTLLAAGCLAIAAPSASGAVSRPPVPVVAAENTWGDIAAQIGGHHARVTSLISSPNADPHLFETDARDAATLASARVVVVNGAGYDTWTASLLGADGGHPIVVDAASVLGVSGHDPNPHLWYDIPRVPRVAAAIAAALGRADPADTTAFRRNLRAFDASLAPLGAALGAIRARHGGTPVAYTERVAGYLLADAGLRVRTPAGFSRSVEDGADPSPADTIALRRLLSGRGVAALLYNTQAVTPVTAQMRTVARAHGVPVVGVSETMPAHDTYQRWQGDQIAALARALGRDRTR